MALVECRECGKEVSAEAKVCPNCGIAKPAPQGVGKPLLVAFVSIVLLVVIGGKFGGGSDSPTPSKVAAPTVDPQQEIEFQRTLTLVRAVKKSMNDPSSFDVSAAYASATAVGIEYRGKNAFGALVVNYAVLTNDGKIASGSRDNVSGLWNKHIANHSSTDLTRSIQGAKLIGVY